MGSDTHDRRPAIVLVAGDFSLREMLSLWLSGAGHAVAECATGEAALRRLREQPPGLIVLDVPLPDLTAEAFFAAYQALPGPHAPVILLNGRHGGSNGGQAVPAVAVLRKPFDLDDLLAVVRQYAPPPA